MLVAATVSDTFVVFAAALFTAVATGLGALPLLGGRRVSARTLGIANALAAGVMIGASVALAVEGVDINTSRTVLGFVLGGAFLILVTRLLAFAPHDHAFGGLTGLDARKALLIVVAMTVHSAAEGIGVGSGFGGGEKLGWLLALAIAIHNIPEGLAISLVMVPRGASVRHAALWSIFTSLPQPLLAVPAFIFVEAFSALVPVGLGFAAGAMVWLAGRELIPDALKGASRGAVAFAAGGACIAMIAFQLLLL